jgi:carbamoyl-phosphate synthase large subunit
MRRKAVERSIPCLTSVDTANAIADCLMSKYWDTTIELVDINKMRTGIRKLNFTKMQACGNDYIYFNCLDYKKITDPESLSIKLSDRHLGIGGHGVVVIKPSRTADAKISIYNMDGTPGGVGGNALCCVAKYLFDEGIVRKPEVTIETDGFIRPVQVVTTGNVVSKVIVDMGPVDFCPKSIPTTLDSDKILNKLISIGGEEYHITCLNIGNSHSVVFCDDVHNLDVQKIGYDFENDPIFPEKVNAEFVQVLDDTSLMLRQWEQGNGETQSCGTCACAAAIAAVENGFCKKDSDITVKMDGGDLIVRYDGKRVYMTGQATKCFDGMIEM